MKTVYFLYRDEHEELVATLGAVDTEVDIVYRSYSSYGELESLEFDSISHIVVAGSIPVIKEVISIAVEHDISVGILPLPQQNDLTTILDLPKRAEDAFLVAIVPSEQSVDLFYCNDTMVLSDVHIGNTSILKEFECNYADNHIAQRLALFYSSITQKNPLRHHKFTLRVGEQAEVTLSAIGMIGLDYDNRSWMSHTLSSYLSSQDGQHILGILSPTSLFQHFISQPFMLMWQNRDRDKLPKTIGFVKGNRIEVDCDEPIEVRVDDSVSMQTPVILKSVEQALRLTVGDRFWQRQ